MTQRLLCRTGRHVAVIVALAASGLPANAQTAFPNGTIRFVAPNSASTPPDIISRIVAKELSYRFRTGHQGVRFLQRPGGQPVGAGKFGR